MFSIFIPQDVSLYPPVYRSRGLLQAHFDSLGGSLEEYTYSGNNDLVQFSTLNNQVIIPTAKGGGQISYMRGLWAISTLFRWNGFISDLDPSGTLPAAKNYLASQQPDLNNWIFGAQATLTISSVGAGGVITAASIATGGKWYAVGNIIPFNGGNNDGMAQVTSVDSNGALTGISIYKGGTGYSTSTTTCKPAAIS